MKFVLIADRLINPDHVVEIAEVAGGTVVRVSGGINILTDLISKWAVMDVLEGVTSYSSAMYDQDDYPQDAT
jgi:hypothetical protein